MAVIDNNKIVNSYQVVGKSVKTSAKGIGVVAGETTRATSSIIVDFGRDPYEKLEDTAVGITGETISHATMLARNGWRTGRSIGNILRKKKLKKELLEEEGKITKKSWKNFNKMYKDFDSNGINRYGVKRGFSATYSTKKMLSNQSRKALGRTANSDDMFVRTLGKTGRAIRYKKKIKGWYKTGKNSFSLILGGLKHSMSFVVSLPSLVVSIGGSAISIFICIIPIFVVVSFFAGDFEGRVEAFADNQLKLEERYSVHVNPSELLAITEMLGWDTNHSETEYTKLIGLMCNADTKADGYLTFDEMYNEVFVNKYPLNFNNAYETIRYKDTNIVGIEYTEPFTIEDYEDIYYDYFTNLEKGIIKDAPDKEVVFEAIEYNSQAYTNRFFMLDEKFQLPIDKNLITGYSNFGYRGVKGLEIHNGLDFTAPKGSTIQSLYQGTVVYVETDIPQLEAPLFCLEEWNTRQSECGWLGGGNQVVIRSEIFDGAGMKSNLYIMYLHMDTVDVVQGDVIDINTPIGTVGSTGASIGSHLHISTYVDEEVYNTAYKIDGNTILIDPFELFEKGEIIWK